MSDFEEIVNNKQCEVCEKIDSEDFFMNELDVCFECSEAYQDMTLSAEGERRYEKVLLRNFILPEGYPEESEENKFECMIRNNFGLYELSLVMKFEDNLKFEKIMRKNFE